MHVVPGVIRLPLKMMQCTHSMKLIFSERLKYNEQKLSQVVHYDLVLPSNLKRNLIAVDKENKIAAIHVYY